MDELADAWALDFDDDLGGFAVDLDLGPVDLGDAGRSQRFAIEAIENFVQFAPKVFFDDLFHDGERFGGNLVSTLAELGHEFLGEHAFTRRNDLGQLDEGRSKAF